MVAAPREKKREKKSKKRKKMFLAKAAGEIKKDGGLWEITEFLKGTYTLSELSTPPALHFFYFYRFLRKKN
jgi:hypothetical protein